MEVCNLSLSKSEKESRLKKRNNTKHGECFDEDTQDFLLGVRCLKLVKSTDLLGC